MTHVDNPTWNNLKASIDKQIADQGGTGDEVVLYIDLGNIFYNDAEVYLTEGTIAVH